MRSLRMMLSMAVRRFSRTNVEEKRGYSGVRNDRLGFGHFDTGAGLAELLDDQPRLAEDLHPFAQRSMKSRGAKRRDALSFLLWQGFEPPNIDPCVAAIEVVRDLDGIRIAAGVAQHLAVRRSETGMQYRELQETAGSQHPRHLLNRAPLIRHVHQRHESDGKVEGSRRKGEVGPVGNLKGNAERI